MTETPTKSSDKPAVNAVTWMLMGDGPRELWAVPKSMLMLSLEELPGETWRPAAESRAIFMGISRELDRRHEIWRAWRASQQ